MPPKKSVKRGPKKCDPDRALAAVETREQSAKTAEPGDTVNWLKRAIAKVQRLGAEPSSAKKPSAAVIKKTCEILRGLFRVDWKPTRVVLTADGGISLWFYRAGVTIHIEISN